MSESKRSTAPKVLNLKRERKRKTHTNTANITLVTAVACTERFPLETTSKACRVLLFTSGCRSCLGSIRETFWSTASRPCHAIVRRRMSPNRPHTSCKETKPASSKATRRIRKTVLLPGSSCSDVPRREMSHACTAGNAARIIWMTRSRMSVLDAVRRANRKANLHALYVPFP